MANISVKICGNPRGNEGFKPLFLCGTALDVRDNMYVGFGECKYFFTVVIEPAQVVYKLIKNNVRSFNAARQGSLVIAFAIPKGYHLEGNHTPYEVLIALKDAFISQNMTLRDPVRDAYEFNENIVDAGVREVVSRFTLSQANLPYRPMKIGGASACVKCTEQEAQSLLSDVQYKEFAKYGEIIIAENVGNTEQPQLNVVIPRPLEYSVIVDGAAKGIVRDKGEKITANSNMPKEYYTNISKSFNLAQLLAGQSIEGVTLDNLNEEILVDTKGWATPLEKVLEVKVIPEKLQNALKGQLMVDTTRRKRIPVDNNFRVALQGTEIEDLARGLVSVRTMTGCPYQVSDTTSYGNSIRVSVVKQKIGGARNNVENPRPAENPRSKGFSLLMLIIISSILLLSGIVIGYFLHDPVESLFSNDAEPAEVVEEPSDGAKVETDINNNPEESQNNTGNPGSTEPGGAPGGTPVEDVSGDVLPNNKSGHFDCTICGPDTYFKSKEELENHMRIKHKKSEAGSRNPDKHNQSQRNKTSQKQSGSSAPGIQNKVKNADTEY